MVNKVPIWSEFCKVRIVILFHECLAIMLITMFIMSNQTCIFVFHLCFIQFIICVLPYLHRINNQEDLVVSLAVTKIFYYT